MSIEKDDFKFPDEQTEPAEELKDGEVEIEIEVVDDTPPEDKNRKPSDPPEDLTESELNEYSDRVRKRIQKFSKGYHDERRAKEQAQKEREELERVARQLVEENKKLKGTVNKNQEVLLEQAKKQVAAELEQAKRKYKEAYESGDSEAVVTAQENLTSIKLKSERVNNFKLTALQNEELGVKTEQEPKSSSEPSITPIDPRAQDWAKENTWFGSDDEMTSFAIGLHHKLVKTGVDPKSDSYYEKINSRMREVFPEYFNIRRSSSKSNVVAPATRSTAPKKVRLTETQVAIAKKLGVPLELYAKQVAEEMRKQNG